VSYFDEIAESVDRARREANAREEGLTYLESSDLESLRSSLTTVFDPRRMSGQPVAVDAAVLQRVVHELQLLQDRARLDGGDPR
jgi:hypothetical protein